MKLTLKSILMMLPIVLMSGFDGFATMYEMKIGVCSEANPFMNWLFGISGCTALLVKMLLTISGVWILMWAYDNGRRYCLSLVMLASVAYGLLTAWHLIILTR